MSWESRDEYREQQYSGKGGKGKGGKGKGGKGKGGKGYLDTSVSKGRHSHDERAVDDHVRWAPYLHYLDLEPDAMPRMGYSKRNGQSKINEHGQRKLYLGELLFLSKFARDGDLVVYAGAAPGHHIPHLVERWPRLNWFLVDPRPFCEPLVKLAAINGKISLQNAYFTDDIARIIANEIRSNGGRMLFVSDIRTVGKDDEAAGRITPEFIANIRETVGEGIDISGAWVEKGVHSDMETQKRWVHIMQPAAISLKTRFPWSVRFTHEDGSAQLVWITHGGSSGEYFDGELFVQPRARPSSTEVRLFAVRPPPRLAIGNDAKEDNEPPQWPMRNYDFLQIEEVFTFFNKKVRDKTHIPCVRGISAGIITYDYDGAAEISIQEQFLKSRGKPFNAATISREIVLLSNALGRPPTVRAANS